MHFALQMWLPLPAQQLPASLLKTTTLTAPVSQTASIEITPILEAHLFGQAQDKPKTVVESVPLAAPETQANLILQGTIASDDPETLSFAIIAEADGKGKLYSIGKTLPGNAILHSIYADKVLLLRNNRYETLRLREKKSASSAAAKISRAPSSPPLTPSRQLGEYRRQALKDPATLLEYVNLRPVQKEGKFLGYAIFPGKNPELFNDLGLQSGDIVTVINGIRIDSPINIAAMQSVTTANRLDIEILRGEQTLAFSFLLD